MKRTKTIPHIILHLLFFATGVAGLISEVVWNRLLTILLGSTISATSLMVTVFMTGLAAGSYWGGGFFRKRSPSLVPFIGIQALLGVYVGCSPFLLQFLSKNYTLWAPFFTGGLFLYISRMTIIVTALLVPTFLMGAGFPAIVLAVAKTPYRKAASLAGYLYGINTWGAAAGSYLAGFKLLPYLGNRMALFIAGGLYVLAALIGWGLKVFSVASQENFQQEKFCVERDTFPPVVFKLIPRVVFAAGFVSLAYEILFIRLIVTMIGNVSSVFALTLTAFLSAMALSAVAGTWLCSRFKNTVRLFAAVMICAGGLLTSSAFFIIVLLRMPFFRHMTAAAHEFLIFLAVLLPVLFLSALLPIAIRILAGDKEENITHCAGRLYALNTAGGILGAGLTNAMLVPFLGIGLVLFLFSAGFLIAGLMIMARDQPGYRVPPKGVTATVFVLMIVALAASHKLKVLQVTSAVISNEPQGVELKLFHEGPAATITILDMEKEGRLLFLNGVEEVSTRLYHVQLFKALGILPVLLQDMDIPRDVLMIAFGAGISAGAAMDTGLVHSLDVVDLVPDAERINEFYKEYNGDVFHHPKFHFFQEDGRNFLARSRKKYGVIIMDATHPFAHDSWLLYTTEFYQSVRERLFTDGVFAQWLPLTVPDEFFKIILNTMKETFDHVTVWNVYGSDQAMLIATPKAFNLDIGRLQKQLDAMPPDAGLKEYQLSRAADFAALFLMGKDAVAQAISQERRINTDDFAYNEKFNLKEDGKASPSLVPVEAYQQNILPFLTNITEKEKNDIEKRRMTANHLRRLFTSGNSVELTEAYALDPDDKIVLYYYGRAKVVFRD